jgi:hypothetical protein
MRADGTVMHKMARPSHAGMLSEHIVVCMCVDEECLCVQSIAKCIL